MTSRQNSVSESTSCLHSSGLALKRFEANARHPAMPPVVSVISNISGIPMLSCGAATKTAPQIKPGNMTGSRYSMFSRLELSITISQPPRILAEKEGPKHSTPGRGYCKPVIRTRAVTMPIVLLAGVSRNKTTVCPVFFKIVLPQIPGFVFVA